MAPLGGFVLFFSLIPPSFSFSALHFSFSHGLIFEADRVRFEGWFCWLKNTVVNRVFWLIISYASAVPSFLHIMPILWFLISKIKYFSKRKKILIKYPHTPFSIHKRGFFPYTVATAEVDTCHSYSLPRSMLMSIWFWYALCFPRCPGMTSSNGCYKVTADWCNQLWKLHWAPNGFSTLTGDTR